MSTLIKQPGSRGGKFYFDGRGVLHYGAPPKRQPSRVVAPGDLFDHRKHLHQLIKYGSGQHRSVDDLAQDLKLHPEAAANVIAHLHHAYPGSVDVRTSPKGRVRGVKIQREQATGVPDDVEDYTKSFTDAVIAVPPYRTFVKPETMEKGDGLLEREGEGNHLLRYEVAKAGALSRALVDGKHPHVTYALPASGKDHGESLLAELHSEGIASPYVPVTMAVSERTAAGDDHPKGSMVTGLDNKINVRRSMYVLIDFHPKDDKHAEKLIDFINHRTGKRGQERDVIAGSSDVPDIRTNVTHHKKDNQIKGFVNVCRVGSQELVVVGRTKLDDPGFEAHDLYVDSGLRGFMKSLFSVFPEFETGIFT
jgi:hypothetical protein